MLVEFFCCYEKKSNDNTTHKHIMCVIIFFIMNSFLLGDCPNPRLMTVLPTTKPSPLWHPRRRLSPPSRSLHPPPLPHTPLPTPQTHVQLGMPTISKVGDSASMQSWCIVSVFSFSLRHISPHLTLLSSLHNTLRGQHENLPHFSCNSVLLTCCYNKSEEGLYYIFCMVEKYLKYKYSGCCDDFYKEMLVHFWGWGDF